MGVIKKKKKKSKAVRFMLGFQILRDLNSYFSLRII